MNKKIIIVAGIVLVVIVAIVFMFASRKNTMAPIMPLVQKPVKVTVGQQVLFQVVNSPMVSAWNIVASGSVKSVNSSIIVISQNNSALAFTTNANTLFFDRTITPVPTGGNYPKFANGDLKTGDAVQVSMYVSRGNNPIPLATFIILLSHAK